MAAALQRNESPMAPARPYGTIVQQLWAAPRANEQCSRGPADQSAHFCSCSWHSFRPSDTFADRSFTSSSLRFNSVSHICIFGISFRNSLMQSPVRGNAAASAIQFLESRQRGTKPCTPLVTSSPPSEKRPVAEALALALPELRHPDGIRVAHFPGLL